MPTIRIASINAIAFFLFWLIVLLAGADAPPPRGFIWIAVTIAVCAGVVFWRIPIYIDWYRSQRPGRHWRVVLDGIIAGLFVALPFALQGSDEPSITMKPSDYAIWFAVLAMMGVVNSVALYFLNALAVRRRAARQ